MCNGKMVMFDGYMVFVSNAMSLQSRVLHICLFPSNASTVAQGPFIYGYIVVVVHHTCRANPEER